MKSIQEIEIFIKAIYQLNALIGDFSELSKKKPDEQANKFKLHIVNTILEKLNAIIDEEDKPFSDFTILSEEDLPSNSDILIILNQYRRCSKNFASKNTNGRTWVVNGKETKIEAEIITLFGL